MSWDFIGPLPGYPGGVEREAMWLYLSKVMLEEALKDFVDVPLTFKYTWTWTLPNGWLGQPCRILKRFDLNLVLIEFLDGTQVIASRESLRSYAESD